MRQIKSVKDKIRIQLDRVSRAIIGKMKPRKNERELTNVEIDFVAFTYTQNDKIPDEYGQDATEWWNDRVARLTLEQMALYKMRFVEGLSLREIGKSLNTSHVTVDRMLQEMYDVLKPEKL